MSLTSLIVMAPNAYAEDRCKEDPRYCFSFGDNDEVKTKSGKAERTFELPPIKAGFIVDLRSPDVMPHIAVELFEFNIGGSKWTDFSVDAGVANHRVLASLNWEIVPIAKMGPSVWVGYNFDDQEPTFGIGFSVLDF